MGASSWASGLEAELNSVRDSLKDGLLPHWVLSDPRLFELEKIRLWPRVWHFVAHESEVPGKGDFVRRYLGPETQVLVTRSDDEKVRVFLNFCRHRGNSVVTSDCGNANTFTCSYHGWTYANDGRLLGVPLEDLFYGKVDRERTGLIELRSSTYNGLIFANLDKRAEPLEDYLGEFRYYLDLFTKRAEFQYYPPHRWLVRMNWKEEVDSFGNDPYHHYTTHRSMIELGGRPPNPAVQALGNAVASRKGHKFGTSGRAARGSALPESVFPAFYPVWAPKVVEEARKRLSQDQFQVWFNHLVGPMVVFPNFALDQTWVSYGGTGIPFIFVRVYRPVSPRLTEVWSWFVVERDAPEDFKRASYRAYASSFDPAGNFIADDVENFENVTTSSAGVYNVREVEDLYRGGSHRPVLRRTEELTIYDTSFREEVAVSYWLRWIAYLTGRV